ncbi:hypothetical protein [uncultured Victivallis sp.]|uniref:hypothetical protein n=1 Tax=uncultured Victivallis sp. TaxID=354118 RepID=UPI0025E8477E|nr:hypothetical protein [uncultured Victivallis sp.]
MKFQRISDWSRRHPATTGCLGLIFLIVALFVGFDCYSRIRLASEIRTLERMGIPCDIAEFEARQRKLGASEKLTREFLSFCEAISLEESVPASPPAETVLFEPEELPKFLAGHGNEIRAADRFLAEHPDLILWRDCSADLLWDIPFPGLNQIRAYIRLNHDRFDCALQKNDPAEAARNFDRSAILRDYVLRDPFLLSLGLAHALENIRQRALFKAALHGEIRQFDSATLKRWAESMPEVETAFRTGWRLAWENELGCIVDCANHPQQLLRITAGVSEPSSRLIGMVLSPFIRLDAATSARMVREAVLPVGELDDMSARVRRLRPYEEFLISRRSKSACFAPVSKSLLLMTAAPLNETTSRIFARCRVVRTGLAVELFLRKYGRLPQKLDELVPEFLPAVPVNPLSGNPLRFEAGTLEYTPAGSETVETYEGYRIVVDDSPSYSRADREEWFPEWNRAMKLNTP